MKLKTSILRTSVVLFLLLHLTLCAFAVTPDYSRYDCGTKALVYLLLEQDEHLAAQKIETISPTTSLGHSVENLLTLASVSKFTLEARLISADELTENQLPAILLLSGKRTGHYVILENIDRETKSFFIYDPQIQQSFTLDRASLENRWTGVILSHNPASKFGTPLSKSQRTSFYGGDNEGAPANRSGDGDGPNSPPECPKDTKCCPTGGAPGWTVNPINMNLYVSDKPLWYRPATGPSVDIKLGFNSMSPVTGTEQFGNKWNFNYNSYLKTSGSTVIITLPSGKERTFQSDGNGGYLYPYKTFLKLTQIAENHYELQFPRGNKYIYQSYVADEQTTYLTGVNDSYGQGLTFSYTGSQLTAISDAQGNDTTVDYNGDLIERITDPSGRHADFAYDTDRNLISITDMGGYQTDLEYDDNKNLSAFIKQGNRTEFYVEPSDNLGLSLVYPPPGSTMRVSKRVTITHPDGGKEEFHYNGVGGYGWRVLPEDYVEYTPYHNNYSADVNKTLYYYTNTAKGFREEISSISYPDGQMQLFTYDYDTGQKLSQSDAEGNTTYFTYTVNGDIESIMQPDGRITRYVYAENNLDLITISNASGDVSFGHDTHHNVTSVTNLAEETTSLTYNDFGQLETITDPNSIQTLYTYYPNHRLKEVTRNGQIQSDRTYDSIGRVASNRDATNQLLEFAYDNLNHITTVTYPDTKKDEFEYNSPYCPHLVTKTTNRSGMVTRNEYNSRKNLTRSINNENGVSQYIYDRNGNLTIFIDANNNSTSFAYSAGNQLIKKIYDDGKTVNIKYNSRGLVEEIINARGNIATFYYDENNNLLTEEYNNPYSSDVSYEYDNMNRIESITDGSGVYQFGYDTASRLQSINGPWANDTISYDYDQLGRINSVLAQGGRDLSLHYDTQNRLDTVQTGTKQFTYSYTDEKSPLVDTLLRPDGSSTSYQYTTLNQLESVINKDASAAIINSFTYGYNNQDLRSTETSTGELGAPTESAGRTDSNFNKVNQLLETVTPDESFVYDDDGNMIEGSTAEGYRFTAIYDSQNRMVVITYSDTSAVEHRTEYTYRWDSMLAQIKKFANNVLVQDTRIIRNGHLALQDRDGSNNIIREYTWGLNLGGGIGGLLNLNQSGADYSYLYDGKGDVVSLLDNTQTQVAQYRYNSFGKLVNSSGTLKQPFQFSTKRYNAELGLNYYGYRFYNPAVERWMNRDPLGEAGGINLYGFVRNDPVNGIDSWGLNPEGDSLASDNDNMGSASDCETCSWRCSMNANVTATIVGVGGGGVGGGFLVGCVLTYYCSYEACDGCDPDNPPDSLRIMTEEDY